MKKHTNLLTVLVSALVFTALFYKNALGLNLLFFELGILGWIQISNQVRIKERNVKLVFAGVIFTLLMTVIHHSLLSFTVNFFMFILYIGVITAPEIQSLAKSFQQSFHSFFFSFSGVKREIASTTVNSKRTKFKLLRKRIFLIPLVIICVFAGIYSWANPKFGAIVESLLNGLEDFFVTVFSNINFSLFFVFVLGLIVAVTVFYRSKSDRIVEEDMKATDMLYRNRKRTVTHSTLALVNEYKSALFLFASLNVLLFGLNIIDVNYVWLNFEWEGQYLKDFVHEGTYVLIFAILLSIVLVIYFFRRNLNFYRKNVWLKRLAVIWIFQNLILTVSVAIRNWHYIQYYSLAYKRIAVVFFLILTIYGLYTVFLKVRAVKSNYYLLRTNFMALVIVLTVSTSVNWDRVIARYNFSHSENAFVHLDFLSNLSNSALPLLDKKEADLEGIQIYQETSFFKSMDISSSSSTYRRLYMSSKIYVNKIKSRKKRFKKSWEKKNWLEWNYAEWQAYQDI